jgi:zinc transporter ZupT
VGSILYSRKQFIWAYCISSVTSIIGTIAIFLILDYYQYTADFGLFYKLLLSFISGGLIAFALGLILMNLYFESSFSHNKKKVNDVI